MKSISLVYFFIFGSVVGLSSEEWMYWHEAPEPTLVIQSSDPQEEFKVIAKDSAWGERPICFPWEESTGVFFPGIAWMKSSRDLEMRALKKPIFSGEQYLPEDRSLFYRFDDFSGEILKMRVSDFLGMGRPQVHMITEEKDLGLVYQMLIQRKEDTGWKLRPHRKNILGRGFGIVEAFWLQNIKGELILKLMGSKKRLTLDLRSGMKEESLTEEPILGVPVSKAPLKTVLPRSYLKVSMPSDRGWLGEFRDKKPLPYPIIKWVRFGRDGGLKLSLDRRTLPEVSSLKLSLSGELNSGKLLAGVSLNSRRRELTEVEFSAKSLSNWEVGRIELEVVDPRGVLLDSTTLGWEDPFFFSKGSTNVPLARKLKAIWDKKSRSLKIPSRLQYAGSLIGSERGNYAIIDMESVQTWREFLKQFQSSRSSSPWAWNWLSPEPVFFSSERELFERREASILRGRREKDLSSRGKELQVLVLDGKEEPMGNQLIELRVLGTHFKKELTTGEGGELLLKGEDFENWIDLASRSPAYISSKKDDVAHQGALIFASSATSDISLSTVKDRRSSLFATVKLIPRERVPSDHLRSEERLVCSSAGKNNFAWAKGPREARFYSMGEDGQLSALASRGSVPPQMIKRAADEDSFLEWAVENDKGELLLKSWVRGRDGFYKEVEISKRNLNHPPRSLLLLSRAEGLFPVVSDDKGVTLYDSELNALSTWNRPGMRELDLAQRGKDGIWVLDRRSNRQSWIYGLKVVGHSLSVEGIMLEPVSVGQQEGGGGFLWDADLKKMWILDQEKSSLLEFQVEGWSLNQSEPLEASEGLRDALREDLSPKLHRLGDRPWVLLASGLFPFLEKS